MSNGEQAKSVSGKKHPVLFNYDGAEIRRLKDDEKREANWKRWGPYLSERQWGTVREDYSENGEWYVFYCEKYQSCSNIAYSKIT